MHSLAQLNEHRDVEQRRQTRLQFATNAGAAPVDSSGFSNDPRAVLLARCVILLPVLVTSALVAGTIYLTSYLLNAVNSTEQLTPVVFLYLLAYLLVLVQSIRFACTGSAFCSETRKKEALRMLVGARLAAWIETSGWFAVWRTKVVGILLLLQAAGIFGCWVWCVVRLVRAAV